MAMDFTWRINWHRHYLLFGWSMVCRSLKAHNISLLELNYNIILWIHASQVVIVLIVKVCEWRACDEFIGLIGTYPPVHGLEGVVPLMHWVVHVSFVCWLWFTVSFMLTFKSRLISEPTFRLPSCNWSISQNGVVIQHFVNLHGFRFSDLRVLYWF